MNPSTRGVLLSILVVLIASPLVMVWSWEKDEVDQCVTKGGSFNYETMDCDFSGAHPYVPFSARHGRLITLTYVGGLILLGIGVAAGVDWRRKHARPGPTS